MAQRHAERLGVYVSVPFCRAKCSFCNFASGVFPEARMGAYVDRVVAELAAAPGWAVSLNADLPTTVDTIYLGGGTPSLLKPAQMQRLFACLRSAFVVEAGAEVTVECAPGQLPEDTLAAMLGAGVNRLSFGVQSFDDHANAAQGRLHTAAEARAEFARLQRAGVPRLALDLIAGLPHQSAASWRDTVQQAIDTGVEHVSVYLLEVDDGSRLGREVLAGGMRFGASGLPDEQAAVEAYLLAVEMLESAGLRQYEISNFARVGAESLHNRRYWLRQPYLGLGLDAHSMLPRREERPANPRESVRWANVEAFDEYMGATFGARGFARASVDCIDAGAALEETLFLGLRLVEGVDLARLSQEFGPACRERLHEPLRELAEAGLVRWLADRVSLTARGRLLSNEVFARLLLEPARAA